MDYKNLREKLGLNKSDYGKLFGYNREYSYVNDKETKKRVVSSSDKQIMKYIDFLYNKGLMKEFCVVNELPEVSEKIQGKSVKIPPPQVVEKFNELISTVTESWLQDTNQHIQNTNQHINDLEFILSCTMGSSKQDLEKMNRIYKKYKNKEN